MAFDQNSIPKDLRPLNVARTVTEEPRIGAALAATTNGGARTIEGVFSTPAREPGSPGSMPVFYPATVPDAGFVGLGYGNAVPLAPGIPAWRPQVPVAMHVPVTVPVGHPSMNPVVGFGYNPNFSNRVVANAVDQVSSDGVAGHGYSPSLGNRGSGNGSDQMSNDMMPTSFGLSSNMGNRGSGNVSDQSGNELIGGVNNKPNSGLRSNGSGEVGDEGGDDSVSGKKVKFLCSFGGKILPRPSDGMLRYVGGQTRIISLRRDVSFNDFMQKMVDTYGQPVIVKYQLPDEDLDALVSISCSDDLDNMMDEYEKVVERSSDGSAKLRVFLFSASELDPSGMVQFGDLHDSGQKYVEAVNGIIDGVACGITRKESIASVASTQNSDFSGTEAVDSIGASQGDVNGPPSTNMLSPSGNSATSHDTAPKMMAVDPNPAVYVDASAIHLGIPTVKSAPPQTASCQPEIDSDRLVPLTSTQQQFGYDLQHHYASTYIDPRHEVMNRADYAHLAPQMGFSNSNLVGNTSSVYGQQQFCDNAPGFTPHQFIPALHMTMTPSTSHVAIRPAVIQPVLQPQQTPLERYPDESTFGARVVQRPTDQSHNVYQAQIPAAMIGGGYAWHHIPQTEHVVFSDGSLPRHQVTITEKIPGLEDCHMCQKALPHAHSDPMVQDLRDSGGTPMVNTNSIYHSLRPEDAMRFLSVNRVAVTGPLGDGIVDQGAKVQQLGHVDQVGALKSDAVGFSQGLEVNEFERNISPKADNSDHPGTASQGVIGLAGELQSPYVLPTQYQFKEEVQHVGATGIQASEQPANEALRESHGKFSDVSKEDIVDLNHLIPIDGMVETLRISNEQIKSPVDKTRKENILDERLPEIAGRGVLSQSKQIDSNEMAILGNAVTHSQPKVGAQNLDSVDVLFANPSAVESAYNLDDMTWLQQKFAKTDTVSAPLNIDAQTSLSPSNRGGDALDSANSLFSNQDPWNLQQDTHFPPPRPNKIQTKREGFAPRGPFGENQVAVSGETRLEDEVYQLSSHLNKDFSSDHTQSSKGSAEELIKKELQAVAEGVAASVFQSSTASNADTPAQLDTGFEANQDTDVSTSDIEMQHKAKLEEIKTKQPDRTNFGIRVSDGIGRLQIIKNSDLEELRELGSGTFGTVYHGKWRGTDVAIKRINDRCFAGKPSEQERMIDDFWNEAIKLAELHHPNVVAFYGVVLDGPGGSVATVTEYMVNGSLRTALQKNERNLDKRKRLLIAMDVAFGMEYLHGRNIVHFDLKSDNLLVNLRDPHRPICKVGDLGLSKVKCQTLISGGVRGTLPWMAPELLNGSSSLVSEKVDVFSFGIVMWELLTGEEPYADLHYGAIIGGIVSNTLRPAVPESCDPEWRSLMERCWSSEPSERPSFTEIANELRKIASKIPPKGQNPS
ncbi:Phox/Bem1p [Corchorus capsularis]|uniref:Phox/Bem1p n=1 Tax=Corchorus capsularis TaxID=210143 RepID=A0A1R3G2G1_COCAP|nr:Phox/Bem1p [Corchorus capsularis]